MLFRQNRAAGQIALTQAAGVVALLALGVLIGALVYLHAAPTGLSPVRNAVSQYGISRYAGGYRIATIAFAVAGAALAVGVERALAVSGRGAVVVLLVVFAVARALISWFPMDAPGAPPTSTGRRHGLLAFLAFTAVALAAFRLASALGSGTRWHALAPASSVLAWAMTVCLVSMASARSAPWARARFGAVERLFYLCAIAWVGIFATACAAGLG